MTNLPPSYDAAVSGDPPSRNAASHTPNGQVTSSSASNPNPTSNQINGQVYDSDSDDDDDDFPGDGFVHPHPSGGIHGDARKSFESLDEENRELPEGWVRCFDTKTNHPFYADTKTGRTTWNHPYDDPTYIASLPDTHPANPNSAEAREARERWEAEVNAREAAAAKAGKKSGGQSSDASWEARHSGKGTSSSAAAAAAASNGVESHDFTAGAGTGSNVRTNNKVFAKRSGIKGFKDKLMGGTKEEREEEKKQRRERERKAQEDFYARRKALIERQKNDPRYQGFYANDPYAFSAPVGNPFRAAYVGPRYGYGSGYGMGYGGGYGMGYGGYGGYGRSGYGGVGMGPLLGLGGGMLLGGMLF